MYNCAYSLFLFLNAFVQECVADDPPVLESAAQCLLLEPSAECLLLEPSAECLLLEPSAECPLLEPSAECLLLGREDAVLVTANCAYPFSFNFSFQVARDYDMFSDRSTPPLVSVLYKCFSFLLLSISGY
jgi:hypothetical protein